MSILNNQTGANYLKHFKDTSHDSILFIDSDERLSGPTNNATYRSEEMVSSDVAMLALNRARVRYNIPTINLNNAVVKFFSTASGLEHTVVLNEGYYTPATLMSELQTQLNTVSGASLITFTITVLTGSTTTYTISATGTFRFLAGSSQVDKGLPCTGLFPMSVASASITVVSKAMYTSYLDFCIAGLTEGQTRSNSFSHYTKFPNSAHIGRIHCNTERGVYNDIIIDYEIHNLHYNKIRRRKLSEITIEVYDENGSLFYENSDINYLSYALEISLLS